MPKVSVIIPVYGVERYVGRCARSLFGQTMADLEFIFVDDCTPDDSIAVLLKTLDDYPDRKHQVRVIRHDRNQGVAAARTTGMKAMTGEYMIHCDPDDWIEPDMYERMYDAARTHDADVVTCRYYEDGVSASSVKGFCHSGRAIDV